MKLTDTIYNPDSSKFLKIKLICNIISTILLLGVIIKTLGSMFGWWQDTYTFISILGLILIVLNDFNLKKGRVIDFIGLFGGYIFIVLYLCL